MPARKSVHPGSPVAHKPVSASGETLADAASSELAAAGIASSKLGAPATKLGARPTSRPANRTASRPAQLSPTDHFRKFLQDGQYRITAERFEVLEAVLAWDDHFDADNLFIYLKNSGSKVSRATVYKTLNLLHECGLVSRYRFSQGHAQYEKTTGRPHHDHMVCTKCGKIIEFENSRVERLQEDACAQYGFMPIYHSFQIFGICVDCRTSMTSPASRIHAVQPHVDPSVAATQVVGSGPGETFIEPFNYDDEAYDEATDETLDEES